MNLSRVVVVCAALLAFVGDVSAQSIDERGAEQERSAVRSAIMQQRVAPLANTHFRFNRGNIAPRNVAIYPLPPEMLRSYPRWRGYMYFVAGDQIVIVESGTLRIVSILPA